MSPARTAPSFDLEALTLELEALEAPELEVLAGEIMFLLDGLMSRDVQ